MIQRILVASLLAGSTFEQQSPPPTVGCRDTHEWVDVGDLQATAVRGRVKVRYTDGDVAPLPEATVIVARVQPFIQAYVTQADARGEFTIPQVPEGRWRVNVCKHGFKTLEASLTIGGNTAQAPLLLTTELDW